MTGKIEMVFTEENGKVEMDCNIDLVKASKHDLCKAIATLSRNLEITGEDWAHFTTLVMVAGMMGDL